MIQIILIILKISTDCDDSDVRLSLATGQLIFHGQRTMCFSHVGLINETHMRQAFNCHGVWGLESDVPLHQQNSWWSATENKDTLPTAD